MTKKHMIVGALLCLLLAGCSSELFNKLSERDINEITSVLTEAGIAVERTQNKDGTYSVSVDTSQLTEASALLATRGLPRPVYDTLKSVFPGTSMVSSTREEQARFMYATEQGLANSISQIPGVVSASVHVVLPDAAPLQINKPHPRASAFIYFDPAVNLNNQVMTIKTLIMNSVVDLAYEDISVALFPSAIGGRFPNGAGSSSSQLFNMASFSKLGTFLAVIIASFALFSLLKSFLRTKRN